MEGITKARIDGENKTLEIKCAKSIEVSQIASRFASLLNNPEDGSVSASKYLVDTEGDDLAEIKYAKRKQAFVMRDRDSIYITDDHSGVGIENICFEYERLCKQLGVTPED